MRAARNSRLPPSFASAARRWRSPRPRWKAGFPWALPNGAGSTSPVVAMLEAEPGTGSRDSVLDPGSRLRLLTSLRCPGRTRQPIVQSRHDPRGGREGGPQRAFFLPMALGAYTSFRRWILMRAITSGKLLRAGAMTRRRWPRPTRSSAPPQPTSSSMYCARTRISRAGTRSRSAAPTRSSSATRPPRRRKTGPSTPITERR